MTDEPSAPDTELAAHPSDGARPVRAHPGGAHPCAPAPPTTAELALLRRTPLLLEAYLARGRPDQLAREWACAWRNRGLVARYVLGLGSLVSLTSHQVEDLVHEGLAGTPPGNHRGRPRSAGAPPWSGLLRAVREYDPSRGVAFSAYAWAWVRYAVLHAVEDRGLLVRRPAYLQEVRRAMAWRPAPTLPASSGSTARSAPGAGARGAALAQSAPGAGEAETAAQRRRREAAEAALSPFEALEWPDDQHSAGRGRDRFCAPERDGERAHDVGRLLEALGRLPERERAVLHARFGLGGEPASLAEAALLLPARRDRQGRRGNGPVGSERTRQVEAEALARLQAEMGVRGVEATSAGRLSPATWSATRRAAQQRRNAGRAAGAAT